MGGILVHAHTHTHTSTGQARFGKQKTCEQATVKANNSHNGLTTQNPNTDLFSSHLTSIKKVLNGLLTWFACWPVHLWVNRPKLPCLAFGTKDLVLQALSQWCFDKSVTLQRGYGGIFYIWSERNNMLFTVRCTSINRKLSSAPLYPAGETQPTATTSWARIEFNARMQKIKPEITL